jgi:hypothetical protein
MFMFSGKVVTFLYKIVTSVIRMLPINFWDDQELRELRVHLFGYLWYFGYKHVNSLLALANKLQRCACCKNFTACAEVALSVCNTNILPANFILDQNWSWAIKKPRKNGARFVYYEK